METATSPAPNKNRNGYHTYLHQLRSDFVALAPIDQKLRREHGHTAANTEFIWTNPTNPTHTLINLHTGHTITTITPKEHQC